MMARHLLAIAVALLALLGASRAGAAVARTGWDQRDVERMQATVPHAVEALEKGEALATAGDFAGAEAAFEEAQSVAPSSTLLYRRRCEALTALGRREEAIKQCSLAVSQLRTRVNLRATVRALVDGPEPPSPFHMFEAVTVASVEKSKTPWMTTSAAMSCDIAASIGDAIMLQHCTEELERIAPNDPDTLRAEALMVARCPPWRFWAGWIAIAAAALGTLVHALLRTPSWRKLPRASTAGAAVLVALVATGGVARAQQGEPQTWLSKWPIDDLHPESSIPDEKARNADPLQFGYWLQDLALKAETLSKHGDHEGAARNYEAMGIAVPDRAISFSKLCDEYDTLNEIPKAINACGNAVQLGGVMQKDFIHFVNLVLRKNGPLSEKEKAALGNVITHLKADPGATDVAAELECEVGQRTTNLTMLRDCAAVLRARAPNDAKTVRFEWALAIQERDFGMARKLIDEASALGVPVDEMRAATSTDETRYRRHLLLTVLACALLLGAAGVVGTTLARRRLALKAA